MINFQKNSPLKASINFSTISNVNTVDDNYLEDLTIVDMIAHDYKSQSSSDFFAKDFTCSINLTNSIYPSVQNSNGVSPCVSPIQKPKHYEITFFPSPPKMNTHDIRSKLLNKIEQYKKIGENNIEQRQYVATAKYFAEVAKLYYNADQAQDAIEYYIKSADTLLDNMQQIQLRYKDTIDTINLHLTAASFYLEATEIYLCPFGKTEEKNRKFINELHKRITEALKPIINLTPETKIEYSDQITHIAKLLSFMGILCAKYEYHNNALMFYADSAKLHESIGNTDLRNLALKEYNEQFDNNNYIS